MKKMPLEQIYNELVKRGIDDLAAEIKLYIEEAEEKSILKGWKKGKGKIIIPDNKFIEIEVYRNVNLPGLMIHREYVGENEISKNWTISHEQSGMAIYTKKINSFRKAVKIVMQYFSQVNWDKTADELVQDNTAREAFKKAMGF